MELSNFKKVRILAKGGFARAFLVANKDTDELFVLKEVVKADLKAKELALHQKECMVHESLSHPFIIAFLGSVSTPEKLYLLMEYASGGDLSTLLRDHRKKGTFLPEKQLMKIFTQCTQALAYMHQRGVLHRDIKASNIFLDDKGDVKLGDFGISKSLPDGHSLCAQTQIGTPVYLAPEVCRAERYNSKADVWALGVLLYEMISLRRPFSGRSLPSLIHEILHGALPRLPAGRYSPALRSLVTILLRKNPDARPTANDVLLAPVIAVQVRESSHHSSTSSGHMSVRHAIVAPNRPEPTEEVTETETGTSTEEKATDPDVLPVLKPVLKPIFKPAPKASLPSHCLTVFCAGDYLLDSDSVMLNDVENLRLWLERKLAPTSLFSVLEKLKRVWRTCTNLTQLQKRLLPGQAHLLPLLLQLLEYEVALLGK